MFGSSVRELDVIGYSLRMAREISDTEVTSDLVTRG